MKELSGRTREEVENHLHRLRDILNNYPGSGMEEDPYTSVEQFIKDFNSELDELMYDWSTLRNQIQ